MGHSIFRRNAAPVPLCGYRLVLIEDHGLWLAPYTAKRARDGWQYWPCSALHAGLVLYRAAQDDAPFQYAVVSMAVVHSAWFETLADYASYVMTTYPTVGVVADLAGGVPRPPTVPHWWSAGISGS